MTTPDEVYKLFIVKRTQVEMLADRGYLIPEDEITMFIENPVALQPTPELISDFIRRYSEDRKGLNSRENLAQLYSDEDEHKTYVYFVPKQKKEKIGVEYVSTFLETLHELGVNNGIFITDADLTSSAAKTLSEITEPQVQIFRYEQLYVNPTQHVLVPKHTRLDPDQRREFFTTNRLRPRDLPAISIDDPIVRYYDWKVGDLIRIERTNLATQKAMVRKSIAYRVVTLMRFDHVLKLKKSAKVLPGQKEEE